MRKIAAPLTILGTLFALALPTTSAQAQATRTWVSGVGDDVNPCSRTAPCKTFAGAVSKTAINGEINCLDPGGFGAVTITKSLTIDCEDTQGSILASSVTGININITTTAAADPVGTVRLRGLSINGAGSNTITGVRGIAVSNANTRAVKLFIDEVFIQNFTAEGIFFNGPGGNLSVRNTSIVNTGVSGGQTAGIRAISTSAALVRVALDNVNVTLNNDGARFEANTNAVIKNSTFAQNNNGIIVFPASLGPANVNIMDTIADNNASSGVFAQGTGQSGTARIFNVTAINNGGNQLSVNANGSILSNGKNHIGTPSSAPGSFPDQ